ncbi:4-hydroxythreonine-4-phosphate dehydrogenase PdxA [Bosea sp. ASV33]|uniref:4-hydroxythreonine-4-phosphate dehydrogenase PdxA n=1 Tax=Bosea sp. ASV33 TaxID=2795106 RepID=UPI0020C0A19A|nr:4-hydroxythreonine-4-phosphate dehydrogenase PdxA [Bosea sp. ASV33]
MRSPALPIAITMGDPSGIGPEITAKFFARRMVDAAAFAQGGVQPALVVGDPLVMRHALQSRHDAPRLRTVARVGEARFEQGTIDIIASSHLEVLPTLGTVSAESGKAAFAAIAMAIDLAREDQVAGIVTAPIHKESLAAAGFKYPGHTEILAERGGAGRVAMMLVNDEIRTVLVTIHCSLREAIGRGDFAAQMSAIRLAHQGGRALGIAAPRIAVAGLNPHAGEGGLFGFEEREIIAPAVRAAQLEGIDASGPWPGDTVFMQARTGRFDVVVAQYHDQGLIPVKYLGLDRGANITLGLPFVRTSPDHGTAFDIAGRGIADPASLETAFDYACRLAATPDQDRRDG